MFVLGKFGVLCFLVTPVLRFPLLPYYQRIGVLDDLAKWLISQIIGLTNKLKTMENQLFVSKLCKICLIKHDYAVLSLSQTTLTTQAFENIMTAGIIDGKQVLFSL